MSFAEKPIVFKQRKAWFESNTLPTHNCKLGRLRKLTLDDFPMDYGFKAARERSLSSRQDRRDLQSRVQVALVESNTLRDYSRQRFQSVVEQQLLVPLPPPPPLPVPHPRIQSTSRPTTTDGFAKHPTYPLSHTPTNGPTKGGSILYNTAPLLSMRGRPQSEPPCRFDHMRGTCFNYPFIQRTLQQSNCEYRLVPCRKTHRAGTTSTVCDTATAPSRGPRDTPSRPDDVMFVPMASQLSDVTDGLGDVWMDDEPPLKASSARSSAESLAAEVKDESAEDFGSLAEDIEGDALRGVPSLVFSLSPVDKIPSDLPGTPDPADETTVGYCTTPSPDDAQSDSGKPRSATSTRRRKSSQMSTGKGSSTSPRGGSARSRKSVSPVVPTPPPEPVRPHCWVDDVTVSSDDDIVERQTDLGDEAEDQGEEPVVGPKGHGHGALQGPQGQTRAPSPSDNKKKPPPAKRASPMLQRQASAHKTKTVAQQQPQQVQPQGGCPRSHSTSGSKGGGKSIQDEGGLSALGVPKAAEDSEPVIILPRFVCPSSESKSRQVALKEWLGKTSFTTACRTLPIM